MGLLFKELPKAFTLKQEIECIKRELGYRERVYSYRVFKGKMTQEKADYETGCMKSVLQRLEFLLCK